MNISPPVDAEIHSVMKKYKGTIFTPAIEKAIRADIDTVLMRWKIDGQWTVNIATSNDPNNLSVNIECGATLVETDESVLPPNIKSRRGVDDEIWNFLDLFDQLPDMRK